MNDSSTPVADSDRSALVAERALRDALERFVRAKVPSSEVEDIVQSTLTDALAAEEAPGNREEIHKWIYGIARHKIADFFRRAAHERRPDSNEASEVPAESAPHSARDLLRWAHRELPGGEGAKNTLEWMLREGHGEKLEHIAEEVNVAAPRVRQRVSRLRRYFRERWAQQLAAVAAVILLVLSGIWIWATRIDPQPRIVREAPSSEPPADERVVRLRRKALDDCSVERWQHCLEKLDEAKQLDPAGDARPDVQEARRRAQNALAPEPDRTLAPDASATSPAPPSIVPTAPVPTRDEKKRTLPTPKVTFEGSDLSK